MNTVTVPTKFLANLWHDLTYEQQTDCFDCMDDNERNDLLEELDKIISKIEFDKNEEKLMNNVDSQLWK